MIIDFHTHCFPDALAPRAMAQLSESAKICNMSPKADGTADGLLSSMKKHGIDRSVVCNIATNPHQMHKVNDFALFLAHNYPSLTPLGSLHPDGEELEGELIRLKEGGIKGIKIHPDYVHTHIDDGAFDKIYSLCEEHGFFVISHTGFDPISPDHLHATPEMILNVLKKHPKLTLIAAHMGGLGSEEGVLESLVGKNLYFDTSLFSYRQGKEKLIDRILNEHDPDKLLFGTDTPWTAPSEEIEALSSADISDGLRDKIFYRNAEKLLGI